MKLTRLTLGMLNTNCYILSSNNDAIIIDPADNFEENTKNLNVVEILVTHHHFDHVGALRELENHFGLKHNNFHCSKFNYEVIKTPGHTDDLVTFYFKELKWMFCGDFIFKDSIGRFDFPESNPLDMINSLKLITKYPDDIIVYPGHGESTTLGKEKENFKSYFM